MSIAEVLLCTAMMFALVIMMDHAADQRVERFGDCVISITEKNPVTTQSAVLLCRQLDKKE